MKANAPEKLYLSKNIYSTYLYQVLDPDDETAIEYIREDAFIEKVLEWVKNRAERFVVNTPLFPYYDYKKAVDEFRKYMEGE